MINWKPIKDATELMDGSRVLLWVPPYGPSTGHYDERWHCHSVLNRDAVPTHYAAINSPGDEK